MLHTYKYNGSNKTLIMFHGTGGDENSLVHLANQVAPNMNHLALRGDVVSFGQRRFAKISSEDQLLDLEDMLLQASKIRKILEMLKVRYNLGEVWALGFSNGANAIISLLLNEAPIFDKAILMRPMDLDIQTKELPLNNMEILIHSGKKDTVIVPELAYKAEERLRKNGANVEHVSVDLDHRMRQSEIDTLAQWFKARL
ncbi:MAG: alpha/beta hydrolase [Erysipelothrix sp.]|nr:alpha/beta hydrolase [Erysipelothrix sp.]